MAENNSGSGSVFWLFVLMAAGIYGACSKYGNNKSSTHQSYDSTEYYDPAPPVTDTRTIVSKMNVRAEVFHYVYGQIKDANRTVVVTVTQYSDGSISCSHGELGHVRYSALPGYEYECNSGDDIYAFNLY